ncbi:hypothetical protein HDU67_002023, partial [Dinochytrium kinnereticum]
MPTTIEDAQAKLSRELDQANEEARRILSAMLNGLSPQCPTDHTDHDFLCTQQRIADQINASSDLVALSI